MSDDLEKRIMRLEETVAHQQTVIDDLSRLVGEQWRASEKLRREIERLGETMEDLEERASGPVPVTKPPHW